MTFGTRQSISEDGGTAEITLYNFRLETAMEAEDQANTVSRTERPDVTFDDVIGADDAKRELEYFAEYLKKPDQFRKVGVRSPRGVLLYGPPGTGKTMMARAMAGISDATFLAVEGNGFLKQYVGQGSEKVHEVFERARKYAPSILFVDEIDAIARERRGNNSTDGEAVLTAFLTEMDGFKKNPSKPVFVLAATNFDVKPGSTKSLEPALMRRFDRLIYVDLPDKAGRIRYLQKKAAGSGVTEEELANLAVRSTGMSLADLESAWELALREMIRAGADRVNDEILEEAFETYTSGEQKDWDQLELLRTARHESGHALVCFESGEVCLFQVSPQTRSSGKLTRLRIALGASQRGSGAQDFQ